MLTARQNELLTFIQSMIRETGCAPSYDEMKEAIGISSKSGIHRYLHDLEYRGFIRRLHNRARAIEIIRMPGMLEHKSQGALQALPNPERRPVSPDTCFKIPLMGRIAAGVPIGAIAYRVGDVYATSAMLGDYRGGDYFALEMKGNSMIEAGIFDGDIVIIRPTGGHAVPGEIVLATIDDEEATLKRFRRRGMSIALEPANAMYDTRIFGPDRVEVVGKMVTLVRRYQQ